MVRCWVCGVVVVMLILGALGRGLGQGTQEISLRVRTLGFGSGWGLDFSPDNQTLAMAGASSVQLISMRDWQVIRTLEGHTDFVHSVEFSPDGQTLASGSEDGTIKLWNLHEP